MIVPSNPTSGNLDGEIQTFYDDGKPFQTVNYSDGTLNGRSEMKDRSGSVSARGTWANGIANHLACFDKVVATENGVNLSGKNKADRLIAFI